MKKILLIDNYDSFTYNLVHSVEAAGFAVDVLRNDDFDLEEIEAYDKIIIPPGPGIPSEAGLLLELLRKFAPTKSILGICLGQQATAEVFGARLVNLHQVYHGVSSEIEILSPDEILFNSLPRKINVGRYHSWSVDRNLPEILEVTSVDNNGEVMSLRHRHFDVRGVQFHPESVLTPHGDIIIKNWLTQDSIRK